MCKAVGVDRQVHLIMGSSVRGKLSANGGVEGLHEVHPQVVSRSCLTVLVQHGMELCMVDRLSPTAAPSNLLQPEREKWTQSPAYLFSPIQSSDQNMVPIGIIL